MKSLLGEENVLDFLFYQSGAPMTATGKHCLGAFAIVLLGGTAGIAQAMVHLATERMLDQCLL